MDHIQLRDMSKTQSSNVDGRCHGDEISLRDQRVGTSHSDNWEEWTILNNGSTPERRVKNDHFAGGAHMADG